MGSVVEAPLLMLVSAAVPPPAFPWRSPMSLPGGCCAQLGAPPSVSHRQISMSRSENGVRVRLAPAIERQPIAS